MLHVLSLVFFSTLLIGGLSAITAMLRGNRDLIERALGLESGYRIEPLPQRATRSRPAPVVIPSAAPRVLRAA